MDSSDSDEDCYGNIAQKLQLMKNKYKEDKFVSTDLLNYSTGSLSCNKNYKNCSNPSVVVLEDEITPLDDSEEVTLDSIILENSKKRVTRSRTKLIGIDDSLKTFPKPNAKGKIGEGDIEPKPKRGSRKTNETSNSNKSRGKQTEININSGRKENRRTSKRGIPQTEHAASRVDSDIPTYSIGNTDYYEDFSDNQQIFTAQPDTVIILGDDTDLIDNEELSVKVFWQSNDYVKFTIRKYQKFTQIFDYFAKTENVTYDKLIFMYNDKILRKDDTPETINYNIVKFIEGGITNQNVCQLVATNKKAEKGLKLKFRCENSKKPFEVTVNANEKLSLAMVRCAEYFETPSQKLKFIFDGEILSACAKLYGYWIVVNYREAYGMFACNGLLFNHESPRRGENFVTRKITRGVAKITLGLMSVLELGNLDSKRDWGHAKDYVEAMWLMLQQDEPEDFVVATGEAHSVREFVEKAFAYVGREVEWRGVQEQETGHDAQTGQLLVKVNPKYFRPTEVDLLLGDPTKAKEKLGWTPRVTFEQLVKDMVEADLQLMKKNPEA